MIEKWQRVLIPVESRYESYNENIPLSSDVNVLTLQWEWRFCIHDELPTHGFSTINSDVFEREYLELIARIRI